MQTRAHRQRPKGWWNWILDMEVGDVRSVENAKDAAIFSQRASEWEKIIGRVYCRRGLLVARLK